MADNRLIRQIARGNGGKLLNTAIDTLLPLDSDHAWGEFVISLGCAWNSSISPLPPPV